MQPLYRARRYDGDNGDLVASAGSDGVVKVWNTSSGKISATLRANSGQPVLGVDINGGLVAGCSCDKMCRIWSLKTERMVSATYHFPPYLS